MSAFIVGRAASAAHTCPSRSTPLTATATVVIPTLAPTITPMPPTAVPTPVVLNAAQVWASPAVPQILRDQFQSWGFQILATEQSSANLYIDVAQTFRWRDACFSLDVCAGCPLPDLDR